MRAAGLLFILLLRSEPLTSANEPPADARFLLIRDPWTDPPDTVRLDGSRPPENQTAKHIYRGGSKELLSADGRKQETAPENTFTSNYRPSITTPSQPHFCRCVLQRTACITLHHAVVFANMNSVIVL